ncbi:MAG: OmpA family protein [Bacteroidota bacterium]|nr:OmpA family protein [Bacteroidota bacterium]
MPLSFEARLGYVPLNGTLKADETTTVLVGGNAVPATFEHTVDATAGMIALMPMAGYSLFSNARILAGPTLGYIAFNNFSERETLIQPVTVGTFENGLRTRNVYSGVTPHASKFYFGLNFGAQYQLPLNSSQTLLAFPEAFYSWGLTPLVSGMNWRANSVAIGLLVEYHLRSEPPQLPPTPQPAAIPSPPPPVLPLVAPPVFTVGLSATTIDSASVDGSSSVAVRPMKRLVVEDYVRIQYRPLLNYVFFDKGSAVIPGRYHAMTSQQLKTYDFHSFNNYPTLQLYYELLNVIGERLREIPNGKITIVGCSDGVEPGGKALSRTRATAVSGYLHDVWGIEAGRMKIESRELPQRPSPIDDSDGAEENRRVEIYSDLWPVVEPILTRDTAHIPKPEILRFLPSSKSSSEVTEWEIAAGESNRKLKDFTGKGALPTHLDWDLRKEPESLLAKLDTIHAVLEATNQHDQEAESNDVPIPVHHYTLPDKHQEGSTDTIISRYSLILFDFDRSELSASNRRIADFVKSRIAQDSRTNIFGYTDRIGSDEYNRQLSELRARTTEQTIGVRATNVQGLGRSVLLYDNTLPEGRFYSRTVSVIVTTPVRQ